MARPVKLSTRDRRMARRRPPLRVRAIASSDQSNVYVDPARGLIATMSLPILIYDERRLIPAPVLACVPSLIARKTRVPLITQLEQMEAHVNGLAGMLVRVRFANGGSVLEVNDQARIALASAGRAAKQIIIIGRTGSTGNRDINKQIAWARPGRAKRLLVTEGVPGNKIALHGWAHADYVASNATPDGRAAKRASVFGSR